MMAPGLKPANPTAVGNLSRFADFVVPTIGGGVAGLLLVLQPEAVTAVGVGALALLVIFLATARRPADVLLFVPFFVIVAGMKFRDRPPDASLSAAVDAQILFELGIYAVLFFVVAIAVAVRRLPLTRPGGSELWLFGYAALAILSTLWSVSPAFTAVRGLQTAILAIAAVSLLGIVPSNRILFATTVGYVTIVVVAAALAFAFPWAQGGVTDYFSQGHRFGWFRDHPITVAMHAGSAAVLVLAYILVPGGSAHRPNALRRASLGALALALLALMVLTGSRAPVGALLAAASGMVALRVFSDRQALALASAGLGLGLFGALVGATPIGVLRGLAGENSPLLAFTLRGADMQNLLSMGGRLDLWTFGMGQVLERPFTGYGFLASRALILEYVPWAGHAHNGVLQSVLDVGIVGAALLWIPTTVALVTALRTQTMPGLESRIRLVVVGSLVFLILSSFTDPSLAGPAGIAPLIAFLCVLFSDRLRTGEFR